MSCVSYHMSKPLVNKTTHGVCKAEGHLIRKIGRTFAGKIINY